MFARGAHFFALDDKVKAAVPCDPATFVGWERDAEVSPATGVQAFTRFAQSFYTQSWTCCQQALPSNNRCTLLQLGAQFRLVCRLC